MSDHTTLDSSSKPGILLVTADLVPNKDKNTTTCHLLIYVKKITLVCLAGNECISRETRVQSCNTSANYQTRACAGKISSVLTLCDTFFM